MKILIVDDSRAMRTIVVRTLRQAGYGNHTLEEAANGVEALKAIEASPPDLVLSDWNMPGMTGIELLEELNRRNAKIKFGFVTSEGSPEMRRRALDTGALFLITKPFTADSFQQTLTPVIGAGTT
jgi:two-component system chemotaxis response regulator CheY